MTTLSNATLDTLTGVAVPTYDRSAVTTGIVHFGLGNFHRAHQAMYVDRLMNAGGELCWGITGVGVMPRDAEMRDALDSQDHLYTLVLKHPDGTLEPRVIGSVADFLYAPDDPEAVLALMAAPTTRIVSLTVTEGGYNIDHVTGQFVLDAPAIAADLTPGATPTTMFGFITEALRRRHDGGIPPFTVMSCDNIQGNGDTARQTIVAFATAKDPELGAWIERHVSFPNSMVDRITPVTTDADRAMVRDEFGIDDAWPVVAEPFEQWVLEDRFTLRRPLYETAGVQVVEDVVPYELMKLRLLNASHQAMAYFGLLSGHTYAHEAATDPLIARLLERYMDEEATPTLDPVPGIDLDQYKATLMERFGNPAILDTLARLAAESSDRIPKWLLPVVRADLEAGLPIDLSAAVVASWARYAEGVGEHGERFEVVDQLRDVLMPAAAQQRSDDLAFLRNREVFGDLVDDERFTAPYRRSLGTLCSAGAQAALDEVLSVRR
ncbi:mannitol dehydrogenase family protein [Curtobacterium sp. MCBD17_035]|uniref:mannitol dehydrogenase family protein n=1 Tax=Curtobacterium sp. MCBD17_035 TaxID=2175673 RepID=UPI000DA79BC8|nr:mannitol dehydrogenase family protein [Curtobacterium sp. MCBD17_035]WIB68426.1 mannitol dehydrogenase family protein [Curtobacterium sp. MCBD17_035]